MSRRNPLVRFAMPVLASMAGCFLDTAPIAHNAQATQGPALGIAGAAGSQPEESLPAQVTTGSAGRDSGTSMPVDAAPADASAPVVTPPPPPPASSAMTDAGVVPPAAASDAGTMKPPVMQCAGLGSYGLRAAIDTTWDATAWSDVGRGIVEVFGIVRVDAVDPQAQTATGSFRACGLILPTLNSSALCSSYQLQFPERLWDEAKLPEHKLTGTYECEASHCTLTLTPASFSLGIQLAELNGPWPDVEDTSPAQFTDDDGDGFPGVSVDVVSVASLPPGQNACAPTGSSTGSSQGPGNTGPGNPWPNTPGTSTPTTTPPTLPAAQIGRLLLGLRTQLTAAMKLAPDCALEQSTASEATVDLRSAGCFVMDGTDPASASLGCSEELRDGYDQILPHYEVLEKGKVPGSSSPGPGRPEESPGTLLKAVRFEPGTQVDCERARALMF